MVIAIDYDETITDNTPFPKEGKIRPEAKEYIKKLYEKGYTLILWTARQDPYYQEAIERLHKEDLYKYFTFDKKLKLKIGKLGKIEADFYIDDRSCLGEIDWRSIYKYITEVLDNGR